MSRFLVVGGAGFIGSNLAEQLTKTGHYVRVLDDFSSGVLENLEFSKNLPQDQFELIKGDITNPADCNKACEGIDYVLHHAALRLIPESLEKPLLYNKVNIDGTLNMLQASLKHKVKRFVLASSSSIYGDSQVFPQLEDHAPLLISPYALTKLAGEYYCRIFSYSFGLETVCLRYFNIFGPRQALDDQYSVVIPKFIHCLLNNQSMPIYGTGQQSRDFTYIDNVVSANILAATTPGIKHEVFNVGTGKEQSVLYIVDVLNQLLGKNIKPQFLPARAGDLFKSNGDISKIQQRIAYKPIVSFEEGLKKTVEYFKAKWQ